MPLRVPHPSFVRVGPEKWVASFSFALKCSAALQGGTLLPLRAAGAKAPGPRRTRPDFG